MFAREIALPSASVFVKLANGRSLGRQQVQSIVHLVASSVPNLPSENITVVEGFESVTEYVFNTAEAPHFFCIICGTHTHHKSRNNPGNICVNVACIDDFNIADYKGAIKNFDGINHPRDS